MTGPAVDPVVPTATFCAIPWLHLFGDELGHLRPCCQTINARADDNVDASGRPHVVFRDLDEGWNSPFMKSVRRDMLEGRRPPVCSRCFGDEDLSIRSYRQDSNVTFAPHVEDALAGTLPDGSVPLRFIRSLDLRLGNLCNVKCRMCSPVSSKLLIPEWAALFNPNPEDMRRLAELERVDWFASDAFWESLEPMIPNIERLHFAGGEPLLITRMIDFLAKIVESGRAGGIVLSYVTNLTSLPARVTSLWPAFKDVRLVVSLDGDAPVHDYIRFPSRFEQITANIRRLVGDPAGFNCAKVTVNTTVQAYNVLRLTDLFEAMFTIRAPQLHAYPRLTLLYHSPAFSIQVLPAELKALAVSRLRAFVARREGRWPDTEGAVLDRFLHGIDGVIEHLSAADRSDKLPEFVRRTLGFDQMRGQDVRAVLPELAPLFAGV